MLSLLALFVPALPTVQDSEPRQRELPDGSIVLVEGELVDGVRDGRWVWSYGNGGKRVRGLYKDGERSGKHADLLLKALYRAGAEGGTSAVDHYYWQKGTAAMYHIGGTYWRKWEKALLRALLESQRHDGHAAGSWGPEGPWGVAGGRIYSTAMAALCLEQGIRFPSWLER